MLPRTFLTQLIPARLVEALNRIQAEIWRPVEHAAISVRQTPSFRQHRRPDELTAADFTAVPPEPFCWGPKYAQRWFSVALPPAHGGGPRYLRWNDQAEATAYVGGVPHYGLDLAHLHCPVPEGVNELLIESVCLKTGIWLDGSAAPLTEAGSLYAAPRLETRNDLAWAVYHDFRILFDVLRAEYEDFETGEKRAFSESIRYLAPFVRASPLVRRWCARLDAAVDVLDRAGLGAFRLELQRIYADFPAERGSLRAVLTGHAHIDLVWLWPESAGEFKAVHSWATQTRLLDAYPEFRFGYSQPASYAAVARRAPALHARVEGLIRSGRWEATGGLYVESDTQLPCGEGLLRALRLGQRAFADLRGRPSRVCWLPDAFGYSGVLPQLLRASGIDGFFTTKLSWNPINRLPHTSFRWRGADGSTVAAHVVQLHDYNEAVDVRRLREDALHHQQAAVHPEFLVPTGYGDGGGGPTEEMCERARRIRDLAGVPRTEWGGIEDFFERLSAVAPELPEVAGELLFELHRGVFTTHGRLKAAFRGLERGMQTLEAVHSVLGLGPIDEGFWRRLVFAQFHDYIPGSSVWEVYAEALPELEGLAAQARGEAMKLLRAAEGAAPGWFNPLPLRRTWVHGDICYELPALGGGLPETIARRSCAPPVAAPTRLRSDRVEAEFSRDGGLLRLAIDGGEVALAPAAPPLCAYPDHPAKFEAWDVDRTSLVAGIPAQLDGEPRALSSGLEASVSFSYRVARQSRVVVRFSVTAAEPVLRIDYQLDWRDPEFWLKAIFATRYAGREARFGAPYGSVLRGQWPGYTREEAQWEVPASRWMIVQDDNQSEGLAVITEANYGFTVRDGVVGVSLLRSARVTGADEHGAIRETPDRPRHSDLGNHRVRLALGRHVPSAPAEEQPAALADVLFTPCLPSGRRDFAPGLLGLEGAPSLVPCWAEPLEGGDWVLRLHETLGRRGSARVRLAPGWSARLEGLHPGSGEPWVRPGRPESLQVEYSPYQVLALRVRRDDGRADA